MGNFWLITTWSHPMEPKWWNVPVGNGSKVFSVTALCAMSSTTPSPEPKIHGHHPAVMAPCHQRQTQQPQKHTPLSHLSTDWHWASVWNKCSVASPASLIQEMGNWTLGCMTHLKAAGKLVKTWDPGTLVPRLGDFQEGKDEESSIASTAG